MAGPTANWSALSIQIPGQDFLESIREILETLLVYLEVLKAILDTIKSFLVDFGNPVRALVEALLALVQDLFAALKRTGLYAYYDIPNPIRDPSLKNHLGGYQSFTLRFKGSLLDQQDSNRPQPVKGALTGGFFLIVADAVGPLGLIQSVTTLLKFFGQSFKQPRYLPPANLKVLPVGSNGDPILAVAKVFSSQVTAVALEWTLPSTTPSRDRAMQGLEAHVGSELVPPKWLIERAEIPLTQEIVIDPTKDDYHLRLVSAAGPVMMNATTSFTDPRHLNTPVVRKQQVVDQYGDPVLKFNTAAVVGYGSSSFIFGQLGTYRFIDTNVKTDTEYHYRIRAFTGPLDIDQTVGAINFKGPLEKDANQGNRLYLPWPSTDPKTPVVVGKPSAVVRVKIAKIPTTFDVIGNLQALFLTAFSLNFHLPLPAATPILDGNGNPILDAHGNPTYAPQFDSHGEPIAPLTVLDIGKDTLSKEAGLVIGLAYLPVVDSTGMASAYAASPITGLSPQMPWTAPLTKFQAARLADRFGSLLLSHGSSQISGFQSLMNGSLPKGSVQTKWPGVGSPTNLSQLVTAFTAVDSTGQASIDTAKAYGDAFKEEAVRRNVLVAINYLKAMGYAGRPPDWVQISLLRDMIPWSGQLLYDIIAKIRALLDAYSGVMSEIQKFIDVIERKINALEDFIKYLITILDFIASLDAGFYILAVPSIDGDVTDWMSAVDNAGGDVPPSGPGGYSAGVGFAYLAPDVTAFINAFSLIF